MTASTITYDAATSILKTRKLQEQIFKAKKKNGLFVYLLYS